MVTGLILLAFIAALITFGWTKLRRRMGMGVTHKTYAVTFAVIVILILALWANSQHA